MRPITSRHNPDVRAFRDLAAAPDAEGARLLLDGAHLVADARAAGLTFERVAVAAARLDGDSEEARLARALDADGVDVIAAGDSALDVMSPVRSPSGIVAIVRRAPATIAAVCGAPRAFVVIAVDVQDPGNVGAIVRVAEAAGATGVIVCGLSANPFSWKALRGSMGSALRLPIAAGVSAEAALACAPRAGLRTIAAVPRPGSDPDAVRWSSAVAVIVGGEGPGLSDAIVAACDEQVTIPMTGRVESLNVAVAAAILVYAARRQRS
jgi:TrmH family RNA methyltransferase